MTEELNYIEKQLKKAEIAYYNAKQRPSTPAVDLVNLERKIEILSNIREVLVKQN